MSEILEKPSHNLFIGDASSLMERMDAGKYDVIVTSPPYNKKIQYVHYKDFAEYGDYIAWTRDWMQKVRSILSPSGSFFLNLGNYTNNPYLTHDICEIAKDMFTIQNEIIWVKSITVEGNSFGHFTPINSNHHLNNMYETIFHFTIYGNVEIDRLAVGVPYKDKSNVKRWKREARDLRCGGNIWFIPYKTRKSKNDHPAAFPIELPKRCIQLHGIKKYMNVLDPFVGSGSTIFACEELGVHGTGIDNSKDYIAVIKEKLETGGWKK